MRVHLDNVNLSSSSGPNSFALRLSIELFNQGHDVVESGLDADVSLVFIEPSGKPLAKKIVQRLDGIWFKPNEFVAKNVNIKRLYSGADAVIWQSEFDKGMTTKWWGEPTIGTVIHNGMHLSSHVLTDGLRDLKTRFDKIFVSSANWHPQKRLYDNIKLFKHLRQNFYPNSCLIVLGNNPDCWVGHPVMYAGARTHLECLDIYAAADWMIHLGWLDHCPNVVVEALSQQLPVICSESGGTKELVGDYGLVLKERSSYDFELVDYDSPPTIDEHQITSVLPDRSQLGQHINIDIVQTTKRYIELFTSLQ